MVSLPYIVYGTITDADSTNPNGAKVILRNDRTGEKISNTTDSSGKYQMDAGNLASGYMTTDRLTVICAYGDADNESSFLISDYDSGHQVNLTLVVLAESSDTYMCQVQDVLNELGDKSTSDITYERIRNIILRAESEIEERSKTKFQSTLVTDEIYDADQFNTWKSPEQLRMYRSEILCGTRNDYWNSYLNDRFKLDHSPILNPQTQLNGAITTISTTLTVDSTTSFPSSGTFFIYNSTNGAEQINYTGKTSTTFTGCTRSANNTTASAHADNSYVRMIRLSRNEQGKSSTDSWSDLEPQSGGGGDFIVDTDTAMVTFVDNYPALGIRKIKTSYSYGYLTVPKVVERLAILLSVRDVLISKNNSSQFDSVDDISLEGISIRKGTSTTTYFTWLNLEIERLWKVVGDFVHRFV